MIEEIKAVLPDCNFPTLWQAVIFRNVGMLPTARIAEVLRTDAATVEAEAARMGIKSTACDPEWEKSGYITIIRANWFILPMEQIQALLRYTAEHLEFVLRNEDFLIVKLGNQKPICESVYYSPLTDEQIKATAQIKSMMEKMEIADQVKPFDFFSRGGEANAPAQNEGSTRFIHGYLTPCGDTFMVDSSEYLSDNLLARYKRQGVNGIWLHGLLASLSPYPYMPSLSEDYKLRRKNLNGLIDRAAKYGIKIYVYFNEPRCLPPDVGPKFPHVTGHVNYRGYAMCMNVPEVVDYLYGAVYDLLKECPIGGIMTITMSENPTHCRSKQLDTNCPRCKNTPFEDICAQVNNTFKRAIDDAGTDTELICNLWSWNTTRGWTEEQIKRGIELLDPEISVLAVSEFDLPFVKGGIKNSVVDYSISNPGPSPISAMSLKYAASLGHKVYAKIQANNSWECCAAPYLPVFGLVKEHLDNLSAIGVENYMLSWTLGGYPSPTLNYIANYKNMSLDEWYSFYYGKHADTVRHAVDVISEGFREYPFSCDHLYFSPQTLGPANLWTLRPEEKRSTMVCFAFDDYKTWTEKYPYEIFISQTEKMLKKWKEGEDILATLSGKGGELDDLIRYTRVAYLHLHADLIHTKYAYMKRDIPKYKDELAELVRQSAEDAKELLGLAAKDATVGYEASNHYLYTPHLLKEKVINCAKLLAELEAL